MLYLAEVQKRSDGFLGGGKKDLKLLACQRSEQNWISISGENIIECDQANEYNHGVLVLVELTNNQKVKKVQEANYLLVGILKRFSLLYERIKSQEYEIEQWKQSLTYQSRELNRREMELESRQNWGDEMGNDFSDLDLEPRNELNSIRDPGVRPEMASLAVESFFIPRRNTRKLLFSTSPFERRVIQSGYGSRSRG